MNEKEIEKYLEDLETLNYSYNTIDTYRRYLTLIEDLSQAMYSKSAVEITFSQLVQLRKEKLDTQYSPASISTILGALSGFESYLIANDKLEKTNISKQIYPKLTSYVTKAFSDPQVEAMKSFAVSRESICAFYFLLATGLRISELKVLEKKDIDWEKGRVKVRESKGSKERVTLIRKDLKELQEAKDFIESYTVLFGVETPFWDSKYKVKNMIDKANNERRASFSTHNTRVTYATKLAQQGLRLDQIQRLLGHENIKTTIRYIDSYIDLGGDTW